MCGASMNLTLASGILFEAFVSVSNVSSHGCSKEIATMQLSKSENFAITDPVHVNTIPERQ